MSCSYKEQAAGKHTDKRVSWCVVKPIRSPRFDEPREASAMQAARDKQSGGGRASRQVVQKHMSGTIQVKAGQHSGPDGTGLAEVGD